MKIISKNVFVFFENRYRKLQKFSLLKDFRDKTSEVGEWARSVFGLPYLKPNEVQACFDDHLRPSRPDHPQLQQFSNYLEKTYIKENSKYPPQLWARQTSSVTLTSNNCESFHSHFRCANSHPNIFEFIETLTDYQTTVYWKINSTLEPKKFNKKTVLVQEYIQKQIADVVLNKISNLVFVKRVSEKNDMWKDGNE